MLDMMLDVVAMTNVVASTSTVASLRRMVDGLGAFAAIVGAVVGGAVGGAS